MFDEPIRFNFTRNADGTWPAVRDLLFPHPRGGPDIPIHRLDIVTPGVLRRGFDVGDWLERSRPTDDWPSIPVTGRPSF